MTRAERLKAEATAFGNEHLFTVHGRSINFVEGYLAPLVNYTYEDKAAKGLRKRTAGQAREIPIYFTALEVIQDHEITLLSGTSGAGKTTFAKNLAFQLATKGFIPKMAVPRNDHGNFEDEIWQKKNVHPGYFKVHRPADLALLISDILPELLSTSKAEDQALHPWLIIIDNIENAGEEGTLLLKKLQTLIKSQKNFTALLLGDCGTVKRWSLPTGVNLYDLLPLLQAQRKQALDALSFPHGSRTGLGIAAKNPAFFSLAIETEHEAEKEEELVEAWLDVTIGNDPQERDTLAAKAFDILRNSSQADHEHFPISFFHSRAIQHVLAARHLMNFPWHTAVELFDQDPSRWEATLISLLTRTAQIGRQSELIEELLHKTIKNKQLAALLVSRFIDEASDYRQECIDQSLSIIQSRAPFVVREKAGRVLSRLGDPRDLTTLAQVPKGTTIHGSNSHPNSQPLAELTVQGFRIGKYPVVNQDYAFFAKETGRLWQSPDMDKKKRNNAPATDLTWHDANAYCAWLTIRWRADGKINSDEEVRLPTEPEWERAALGDRIEQDEAELIWPWGSEWRANCSNYDNLGLNTTCSVGLFPDGRSQFGCYDMAGQVWEWCSTNWGENMATPTFKYPWKNDERENTKKNGTIRRVLRGGCFSSANFKITGTYRGSLEPGGFWRGNGFRVVVASV